VKQNTEDRPVVYDMKSVSVDYSCTQLSRGHELSFDHIVIPNKGISRALSKRIIEVTVSFL
jgi:hypothetical protein